MPRCEEEMALPSRDLSTQGRAILRVAGTRTGKNRWVRAAYNGASVTLGHVSRVLHVLWLELTGLMFLLFALVGAAAAVREYHRHTGGTGWNAKVLLAASIAVMFTYFGLSSFWRSRRRSSR